MNKNKIEGITLRDVRESDLPAFFEFTSDPASNTMAAFTAKDPSDRDAFNKHWEKLLANESLIKKTICKDDLVVGNILKFELFGEPNVSYWIAREHWGNGIATAALQEFLRIVTERPLCGRAASDNGGSIQVLKKCGFIEVREETAFAESRGKEVREVILRLDK